MLFLKWINYIFHPHIYLVGFLKIKIYLVGYIPPSTEKKIDGFTELTW
jgi:hypothetical protein